jgi:hypothetical protein
MRRLECSCDDDGAFLDLLRAIQAGSFAQLAALLRRRGPLGARFDATAWRIDRPLLFYALQAGRFDMADLLLAHGASLTERSTLGLSPVALCLEAPPASELALLDWALDSGADPNFLACDGCSIPMLPERGGERSRPAQWALLHGAAQALRPSILARALESSAPELDSSGATAWHWLAQGCLEQSAQPTPDGAALASLCAQALWEGSPSPNHADFQGLLPTSGMPHEAVSFYERALLSSRVQKGGARRAKAL